MSLDLQSHEGSASNIVKLYEDLLINQEVREGLAKGATLNSQEYQRPGWILRESVDKIDLSED
jgi:hypothetical protein